MKREEERESIVLENKGLKIFGIFHRPIAKSNSYPTVLICHGLAGNKVGKYRIYVQLSERLSQAGIASFRFDFRGSGDSEGHFSDTTLNGEVSDALIALNYLRERKDVDTSRIGIFGRSVGGTVALMTARKSAPIKSIAIWAPLYDGEQWQEQWKLLHAPEITEEIRYEKMKVNGQVPGTPFFNELFKIDMAEHLEHLQDIPMLHIHGELDDVITPIHADRYADARKMSKTTNRFIRLPESDHDFSHTKEQLQALIETTDWFKKTL